MAAEVKYGNMRFVICEGGLQVLIYTIPGQDHLMVKMTKGDRENTVSLYLLKATMRAATAAAPQIVDHSIPTPTDPMVSLLTPQKQVVVHLQNFGMAVIVEPPTFSWQRVVFFKDPQTIKDVVALNMREYDVLANLANHVTGMASLIAAEGVRV